MFIIFVLFFIIISVVFNILIDNIISNEKISALISSFLAFMISISLLIFYLNFEQRAEENINKDNIILTLSETINLSDKVDIETSFFFLDTGVKYNFLLKDENNQIYINSNDIFEIIDVENDFKVEIYDAIYKYREGLFFMKKELKYFKIYMDKENINEKSKKYLK